MKIEWQQPAIDATVAIGGGTLLNKLVIGNISFLADLLAKVPADLMGIDVKLWILGAVALIAYKSFMK